MELYNFSNSNIDLACEEVGKFLAKVGVERREALRTKLTFEEVLLEYQAKLGEEAAFKVKLVKRLSSIKVEIIVEGESYNALVKNSDESDIIQGLLAGIGLAPTWNYKNGKNYIVFIPKKKPVSGTVKMVAAIGFAMVAGVVLNFLPDGIRSGVNDYVLTPVTDTFMGLISAVSVPLIFLSVLGSICSMGNMETLGKIGSKTIKVLLLYMTVISVSMTALVSLFYHVQWGGGGTSGFSQALDLIYDIVPSNLLEPFVTGNTLQLIFISIMIGLAMLVLSSSVNGVFKLVEQFSAIAQTVMSGLSTMLPILIFILFTGMISGGEFGTLFESWKIMAVMLLLIAAYYILTVLYIAVRKKVSPSLLLKKTWKTFIITLTTDSPAASFQTNISDLNKKFGVDKRLAEFGTSLGQVLFGPTDVAILLAAEVGFAEIYGIAITPQFLIIATITNLLLSFSIPPVPGGTVMGYTIAFAQLGIPMDAMGVVLALDAIVNFPASACSVSGWQLTMIEVADSLDMLDKKTLYKADRSAIKEDRK